MSWCRRLPSARTSRQRPTSAHRAKTANAVTSLTNTSMTSREHPIVIATTHRNNAHPHTFRRFSARCLRSTICIACSLHSESLYKWTWLPEMPTPPFSQDRRDWLSEISGLFSQRKTKDIKSTASTSTVDLRFGAPKALDSTSTFSVKDDASTKDQAMAHGPGRAR